MSFDQHISIPRITWVIGLVLGLLLAAMMGTAVANQDMQKLVLVLGGGMALGTFLALGKNYWLLIPLSLGAKFPALPLGGRTLEFPELAIVGCALFFLVRIATRKEKLHLFRAVNIPFLAFMVWVGIAFALNPIGLAFLGSSIGGARFYLKLLLAFAAFLVLSNREYTERDMQWVLALLLFGAFFSMFYGMAEYALRGGPQADPVTGMVNEEFYTWHQVLSLPAMTISFLMFARWSPKKVFGLQGIPMLIGYLLCIGLVLLSGKRMGLIAVLLGPAVGAVAFRQFKYLVIAAVLLGGCLLVIVTGQGDWFRLPLVAQRTLSWMPGDWDQELSSVAGGQDDFRTELRRIAWENIKRDPIIGRGFAVDIEDTITAINMQQYGGGTEVQAAAYALGRSWHNTWLGYAADFGIPISIMQAIIWFMMLFLSWRSFKLLGNKTPLGVFSMYVLIFTVRDLAASWTSGHSATDAFERWWMYGIIAAIYLQTRRKKQCLPTLSAHPHLTPESLMGEAVKVGR